MEIKVLGAGCANCKRLLQIVEDTVKEMSLDAKVTYVTDMREIMKMGIMRLPGLMIDDKVKSAGRMLGEKEVKQMISEEM